MTSRHQPPSSDEISRNDQSGADQALEVPEVRRAENAARPWVNFVESLRDRMYQHPVLRALFKILVALLGGSVVVLGIILVPLPGPGWLVIFVGIAILSVEFKWAARIYVPFKAWIQRSFAKLRARRQRNKR